MMHNPPYRCEICDPRRPGKVETRTKAQIAAHNEELQKSYVATKVATKAHQEAANRRVAEQEKRDQANKIQVFLVIGVFFDGTLNNASNTAAGMMCGAHHPIKPEDLDASCQPYMADPDSSYGNDVSNVAKLSKLYFSSEELQAGEQGKLAYRKIYIDGIGSLAGEKDSSLGASTGRGETGVAGRVQSAFGAIGRIINDIYEQDTNNEITGIIFDTFGFSRGAAAARHFATEVALGCNGPLKDVLRRNKPAFSRYFLGEYPLHFNMGYHPATDRAGFRPARSAGPSAEAGLCQLATQAHPTG
jgi:hypothetical protein